MNQKVLKTLEYHKIIEKLTEYAASEPGKRLCRELEPSSLRVRTVWWGLLCNLGFVGGALALGWFSNVPLWGGIFLVLFLEWGLSAMWFGLHVALRRDTRSLNRKLSEYQKRGPES